MNTEEQNKTTATSNESEEKKNDTPKSEGSLFRRARQNINIVWLICAVIFVATYALVNVSSIAGVFNSVLSVLTPIILGAAIAYILNPILKIFEKRVFRRLKNKRTIRVLSLLMTYVVAILALVAFAFLLIPQLIESIKTLVTNFDYYMTTTADRINRFLTWIMDKNTTDIIIDKNAILNFFDNLLSSSGNFFGNVAGYVVEYGMGLVVGIKNIFLGIFISIYILSSKERLKAQAKKLTTAIFSERGNSRFHKYVSISHKTFSGFFVGMIIDAIIVGCLTLVALLIFRVPSALLVATIVAFTNVIPIFGPFIGAIPSFFIIFIADPFKALLFLILILIIQQIDGNVIAPKILGNSTGISSLGVIISIIIMGEYLGVVGMILGVPIASVIVGMVKEFLETKLKSKQLPTETAEYYTPDSLVDPNEQRESLLMHIAKHLSPSLHSLAERLHLKRKNKKQLKKQQKEAKKQKEDTSNE